MNLPREVSKRAVLPQILTANLPYRIDFIDINKENILIEYLLYYRKELMRGHEIISFFLNSVSHIEFLNCNNAFFKIFMAGETLLENMLSNLNLNFRLF